MGWDALKEAKDKRIQRFENQDWSPLFNSQTFRANGVTLCERARDWRPTVHAWQFSRKSHMLKCYFFFPLHLAFLPLKADSTSPCSHRTSASTLGCRLNKEKGVEKWFAVCFVNGRVYKVLPAFFFFWSVFILSDKLMKNTLKYLLFSVWDEYILPNFVWGVKPSE